MSTVAIVSLGRGHAMGEVRRVSSWRQIFAAAGADIVEIPLVTSRRLHADGVVPVVTGRSTPERLAWSGRRLRDVLHAARPDLVLVVSTRAFDQRAATGPWTLVLDLVDSLSRSYRDRSAVVDGLARRAMYRSLAIAHAGVERRLRDTSFGRVAAGWVDAQRLGAEWVPNTIDTSLEPFHGIMPDRDVLFFGTLRYPPNIDALERMARFWPLLSARRPGTTALIAGASPTSRVRELCRDQRWELVADFDLLPEVAARTRVAVAPLGRVAGIQNKVLDAACLGLPQVVSPEALEGFAPGFPLVPQVSDESFVAAVAKLLDDDVAAADQASALRAYVRDQYGVERWGTWAQYMLGTQ
jgi:glycosyltransferase involved in cell wall biosynthesis